MASLKRKSYTRPLPQGAEIVTHRGQRVARWVDSNGKKHTASVTISAEGTERIRVESAVWIAKFRDADGRIVEVSTGCRDKGVAMTVLRDIAGRVERQKAGILSRADVAMADCANVPLAVHSEEFANHMRARGVTEEHRTTSISRLQRVARDCRFAVLRDLDRAVLERWLVARAAEGMSARTRNGYRASCVAFGNWCVDTRRLAANPFTGVPKANEKADPRRQRRALTGEELVLLLDTARTRPLQDRLTKNRGALAKLTDATRRKLERIGYERALIYKTLVLTGLRRVETPQSSCHRGGPL